MFWIDGKPPGSFDSILLKTSRTGSVYLVIAVFFCLLPFAPLFWLYDKVKG